MNPSLLPIGPKVVFDHTCTVGSDTQAQATSGTENTVDLVDTLASCLELWDVAGHSKVLQAEDTPTKLL
jgi:hypothetical protein